MFRRLIQGIAACLCVIQAAELPVREVILFKHGVGFFSRAGELKAGETARLGFKASDMNDVLMSLTVEQKRRREDRRTSLRFERVAGQKAGGVFL